MCSKTPQNTPNHNKTVKMSPRAPHCCHTPQRPIPAYYTSLVSSLYTLGPTNFEFVHNRIKVSVDNLLFSRFLHFCVFCESTRLWRPEYGDFYTIMANFEFWQPEGTQWANQRGMIRWYRALGRVPSDGPSDVNFNWFSGLRNKPKMG